jgi:hypothetical protein
VNSDVFLESNDSVLLFGIPTFSNKENGCLLHQKGFSTVYSHTFQGPIMLSTKLNKQTVCQNLFLPGTSFFHFYFIILFYFLGSGVCRTNSIGHVATFQLLNTDGGRLFVHYFQTQTGTRVEPPTYRMLDR